MLAPYRRILGVRGAPAFSASGFVARLPISMVGLGMVLLVQERTGSYALAGAVSATAGLAGAAGSPVQGRLADRYGQGVVLRVAALAFAVGLAVLLLAGTRLPVAFVGAALTGGALPQAGSMVRTRWRHVAPDAVAMRTAFAFEAVVDEVVFILGPVVVVGLATSSDPAVALLLAGAAGVVGAGVLSLLRSTEPPAGVGLTVAGGASLRTPLGWSRLAPVVVASVGIGTVFGSTEVVTVAFADEQGAPGAAALLLALWAVGSLVAGVLVGSLGSGWAPSRMFRTGTLVLGLSFVPMTVVDHVGTAALVLVVSGLAISPSLVASLALVEQVVPPRRLTEGMGWATTGLAVGVATGAAAAGATVNAAGASTGYAVPLVAGLLASAMAWVVQRTSPPDLGASGPDRPAGGRDW